MAAGRTAPLKSFLLDQGHVAGVGNIYADEALFRARLHPLSPAGSMKPEHHEALRDGVVAALEAGIERGGASSEGLPCPRCETSVVRIVVSGRSTYYCPSCQVRLRRKPRRRRPARRPS
jgi:formamidopyrimidine-DNA glycosylase